MRIASLVTISLTAALVLIFIVQIVSFESVAPPKRPASSTAPPSDQITAGPSTIAGIDNEQQPFIVRARKAEQDAEKGSLVHLSTVNGELKKKGGTIMTVSAKGAIYDTDTKVLDLEGNVELAAAGKFVANMDKARVFLEQKKLYSDVPVTVSLENGVITANGLEITNEGDRILFFNRVRATYAPADSKGDRK